MICLTKGCGAKTFKLESCNRGASSHCSIQSGVLLFQDPQQCADTVEPEAVFKDT